MVYIRLGKASYSLYLKELGALQTGGRCPTAALCNTITCKLGQVPRTLRLEQMALQQSPSFSPSSVHCISRQARQCDCQSKAPRTSATGAWCLISETSKCLAVFNVPALGVVLPEALNVSHLAQCPTVEPRKIGTPYHCPKVKLQTSRHLTWCPMLESRKPPHL